MKRVYDPNGVELERSVLQITGEENGRVTTCRILYDDETIDLKEAAKPGSPPKFLIVWRATKDGLGNVIPEEAELAESLRENLALLRQARQEIKNTRELCDRLEREVAEKTAALREIQRERDPEFIARKCASAVEYATEQLARDRAHDRERIAELERDVHELRASKRKLREALERAKEGRR